MAAEMSDSSKESFVTFSVSAVLPAAGSGVRMGIETPKQFCRILGRPLISYTLETFERIPWITEIVVTVAPDKEQFMMEILKEFGHKKTRLTAGGVTRHRSILNGIKSLTDEGRKSPEVVIIHDAVRPFVEEELMREVAIAARAHGAAGVTRPLVSTVISKSESGFLDQSLERSKYRASEMPQAFQYSIINNAYKQCTEYDFEHGTECLHLASTYSGTQGRLIDGPSSLWKVTHKKDLYAVEAMLKEKQLRNVVIVGKTCFTEGTEKQLVTEFTKQGCKVTLLSRDAIDLDCSGTPGAKVICHVVDLRCTSNNSDTSKQVEGERLHDKEWILLSSMLKLSDHPRKRERKNIVPVVISKDFTDQNKLWNNIQDFHAQGMQDTIYCFGVFVHVSKDGLSGAACQRVVEMIMETTFAARPIYSGQVFVVSDS